MLTASLPFPLIIFLSTGPNTVGGPVRDDLYHGAGPVPSHAPTRPATANTALGSGLGAPYPHRTLVAATPDGRWREINPHQLTSPTPTRPSDPTLGAATASGEGFREGERVLVKWGVTEAWYPATISKVHVLDGVLTYDIVWDQGDLPSLTPPPLTLTHPRPLPLPHFPHTH